MILGTLIKGLSEQKMWPLPGSPYYLSSFESIATVVRDLTITSLCDAMHTLEGHPWDFAPVVLGHDAHGQGRRMCEEIKGVEDGIEGLDLGSF